DRNRRAVPLARCLKDGGNRGTMAETFHIPRRPTMMPSPLSVRLLAALGAAAALVSAAMLTPSRASRGSADLSWTMIDVTGPNLQGDAHLVRNDERTILIDGGPYETAHDKLLPFLNRNSIRKIDTVLITHPHFDHMGGILAVLEDATFEIGEIYFHTISRERCASEPWGCRWGQVTRLKELAASKSIPIR